MHTIHWAACALLTLGCGGTDAETKSGSPTGGAQGGTAGSSGAGGTAGGGQAGGSGGSAGSAGSSAGSGGSGTDLIGGSITITSMVFSTTGIRMVPNFPEVTPAPPATTSSCTWSEHGACSLGRCPPSSGGTPPPPAGARHHAGTITLDSPEASVHVVTEPDANGSYLQDPSISQPFLGGESFTVTAAGGTLPAFTLPGVFPLLLLIDPPLPAATGEVVAVPVPRTQAFSFSWTRGVPDVELYIQQLSAATADNGDALSFSCRFDSMLGAGTLEADLLAALPSGVEVGLFTVWSQQVETATSSTYVAIAAEAINPDRAAWVQLLTQ